MATGDHVTLAMAGPGSCPVTHSLMPGPHSQEGNGLVTTGKFLGFQNGGTEECEHGNQIMVIVLVHMPIM